MSHYISSFLIEPVVRQARRFSRPGSNTSPLIVEQRLSYYGERTAENSDATTSTADEVHSEISGFEQAVSSISGQPVVQSPTSEDGGLEAGIQVVRDRRELLPRLEAIATVDAYNDGDRSTATHIQANVEDEISDNPLYGVPEQFRSTTTSFSSSMHSPADANMNSIEGLTRSRRNTAQGAARGVDGSYTSRMGDRSLPADDGMGFMRKRIIEIQQMENSNQGKARLIHELMTQPYNSSQASLHASTHPRPLSPTSVQSQDRPITPSSGHSTSDMMQTTSPPTSLASVTDAHNPYNLSPNDLKPTFYIRPAPPVLLSPSCQSTPNQGSSSSEEDDERPLGCPHYKRNVKLQCSSCSRWYTCRFCHDQAEDHSLNRRETKHMLCMLCGCAQPAAEECANCGERGAWYYCGVCKLWDNDPEKSIYHCSDCGICRIGQGLGKDFYHCKVRFRSLFHHLSITFPSLCLGAIETH